MAIGRLSMKVGKGGKAGPHAAYIARKGQYANRLDKGERLEATEVGNMPAWAACHPQLFWQAADAFERSNGTTYREMEIALPRELDAAQRVELVKDWVRQEIGDRHAYQWAIHVPLALDGKDQPHVHLMFSERQVDGIERDPEQYFKRYNGKSPEKGGARKEYGQVDPTLKGTERKKARAADLKELRGRWEKACNHSLEQVGIDDRIDMRSHAERGLEQVPEGKMLPSEWRAHVREFRAAQENLNKVVPDIAGELVNLKVERERRAKAQADDALDAFRGVLEKARARGDSVVIQMAERCLELAQEAQEKGQNPRHIVHKIHTQAQDDVIAGLRKTVDTEGKGRRKGVTERDRARPEIKQVMPAADLLKEWDSRKGELVSGYRRRAAVIAPRIDQQIRDINTRRWNAETKHDATRPKEPTGLFAAFKRSSYDTALSAWKDTAKRIKAWKAKREKDLRKRLERVRGYLSPATPAHHLAEKKLQKERPEWVVQLPHARAEVACEKEAKKQEILAKKREHQALQKGRSGRGRGQEL